MDVIARLPDCDGLAADATSAYTQVKVDAPRLLRIPNSECLDIRIRLPRHFWPISWAIIEDPAVPLGRNLYGHQFAGRSVGARMEKSTVLGMSSCSPKTRIILFGIRG